MAKLLVAIALVCASAIILADSTSRRRLKGGRTKSIFAKIEEEAKTAASAIKSLKISSPHDKVEIFITANEFLHGIHQAFYVYNQAVPHIQKEKYNRDLGKEMENLVEILYDLHRSMYNDLGNLQQKMVVTLESYAGFVKRTLEIIIRNHSDDESFISDKIRECTDIAIYTMYRLFFHATFSTKTSKDFERDSNSRLALFTNSFDKIKGDNDEATKTELIHLARFLTLIGQNAILKLEYWMNMRNEDDSGFKDVKETALVLNQCVANLHILVESEKTAPEIAEEFQKIHTSATKQMQKLEEFLLGNKPGDQEYLRGLLIDNLAVSAAFTTEMNVFLATKHIHEL